MSNSTTSRFAKLGARKIAAKAAPRTFSQFKQWSRDFDARLEVAERNAAKTLSEIRQAIGKKD